MTVPKVIDRRAVWLEGLSLHAAEVLKKLQTRQVNGITPSEAETDIIDLCGGYLYLLRNIRPAPFLPNLALFGLVVLPNLGPIAFGAAP